MKVLKINKKQIIVITLIIAIITFISTNVYGVDTSFYEPDPVGTPSSFYSRVGIVLGWIKYIGILVAVVALTIIGIRYLFGSVEGKAEYKKTMMPYVLGCFLLVATSTIVGLIADVADTTVKTNPTDETKYASCTWTTDGEIHCECGYDFIGQYEVEEVKGMTCWGCEKIIKTVYIEEI